MGHHRQIKHAAVRLLRRAVGPWPALLLLPWAVIALLALIWIVDFPRPLFSDPYSLVMVDGEGELLGATIAADGQWRFPPAGPPPEKFRQALVRFEDRRFYRHPGFDLLAAARALKDNASARTVVSGGSTITMQVIRLARKGLPRTVVEKAIEAELAVRLELGSGKAEVLRLFASYAPFGGNVVGLEAAAWRYFGRAPDNLSWAETALLAVLPNSPSLMRPGRHEEELLAKRNRLIDDLHADGTLDETAWHLARAEPLPGEPLPLPQEAPQLLTSFVTGAFTDGAHTNAAAAGGTAVLGVRGSGTLTSGRAARGASRGARSSRVETTIDRRLQLEVTGTLARNDRDLAGRGIHNAAAIVVDVATGAVLAYAGNLPANAALETASGENGRSVDIVQAERSTGSLLKPFLYAAMVDSGEILPDQLIPDIPTRMGGYMPENFNGRYLGAVRASEALARSLNVPMARLLRSFGIDRFYAFLRAHGMTTLHRKAEDYGIALILGGAEGSLWELTGLYASMARAAELGSGSQAFFAPHVLRLPPGAEGASARITSPVSAAAWWLTLQALLEVKRPDEDSGWQNFLESQPISWKTGTSYGNRDAWAIGVTPKYAVGVWVGNASGAGEPSLRGSAAAAPLLFQIFNLLGPQRQFPQARGLVPVEVCADSGFLAGPYCADRKTMLIPSSARGAQSCPYCRLVHLDSTDRYQVTADCEPFDKIRNEWRFVLPPVMEWYYTRSGAVYAPLPPFRADCREGASTSTGFAVLFPEQNSKIYVPVDYDGTLGSAVFEVIHHDPSATVYWHLDGIYLGETHGTHQWEVHPPRGRHRLVVVDSAGDRLVRDFEVLSD